MTKSFKKRKGFTLIEMTIVLFIISLLVLIIIPNISSARNNATKVHTDAMASTVQSQLNNYLDDRQEENKNSDDVTLDSLVPKYLTQNQVDKATAEGIKIVKGNNGLIVTLNGTDINSKDASKSNQS